MATRPTHGEFSGQLNKTFLLQLEGADAVPLELVEVSNLTTTARQEIFAIVFRALGSTVLEQKIYRLENETMGQMDLFLVPIRKDNESVFYEAVFNRMIQP